MQLIKNNRSLVFTYFTYGLVTLIVSPFGNFPVNDSWVFALQVKAFTNGIYTLNGFIDPSFLSVGALGFIWSKIFGFSFVTLRLLSIFIHLLNIGLFYVIAKKLTKNSSYILAALLLFSLNPLILAFSYTFMTEIFFIFYLLLIAYFVQKSALTNSYSNLFIATFFVGLAFLARHIGAVMIIPVLYVFWNSFYSRIFHKHFYLKAFYLVLPLALSIILYIAWPKSVDIRTSSESATAYYSLFKSLVSFPQLKDRFSSMLRAVPYFAFFLSPFLLSLKHAKRTHLIAIIGSIFLVPILYKLDVFSLGNVMYIENFYGKTNYRTNFSLFDNVYFTLLVSMLVSYSTILLFSVFSKFSLNNSKLKFYIISFVLLFLASFIGYKVFDRYLVMPFIFLLFFSLSVFKGTINKVVFVAAFIFMLSMTAFNLVDYYAMTRLSWGAAREISEKSENVSLYEMHVGGIYEKTINAFENEDYLGKTQFPVGMEYECFVEEYTLDRNPGFLSKIEDFSLGLDNPKIYGSKKIKAYPTIKKNMDNLVFNYKYSSPKFNLVGKDAYVGAFCE